MKDSSSARLKELEQKLKDMERIVGQKQIQIDFLEKMIDIAKTELHIDIKKTTAPHHRVVPETPQSSR